MEKKTVVIGGVGPGLGAALVRRFAEGNCRVAMLARSEEYLDQLAGELNEGGYEVFPVPCDLTDSEQVRRAFETIRAEAGPVQVLIHHAGNAAWGGAEEISPTDFEGSWRVCTFAGFLCVKEALRDMLPRKEGTILFTGATSSARGRGDAVAFSSAKFAQRGMAYALAGDLGPKGIHVCHIIVDGLIDTPQVRERYDLESEPAIDPAAAAETYWQLSQQRPSAWTFELDLRHHAEKLME